MSIVGTPSVNPVTRLYVMKVQRFTTLRSVASAKSLEWWHKDKSWNAHQAALWAALWAFERAAAVANRYMSDQKDPAKMVAASDIKIMLRQLAKDLVKP